MRKIEVTRRDQLGSATAYQDRRAFAYPSLADQLDALWKTAIFPPGSEAEAMQAKIKAVKTKYPKS